MFRLLLTVSAACLLLAAVSARTAAPAVEVEALFTDAAVLRINGERKMLRVGHTHAGVTLLEAHSGNATIRIGDETSVLEVSQRIVARYQEPDSQVVNIPRDAMMKYQVNALINGRGIRVLVDTGANVVAMNSQHANQLGVDHAGGSPTVVETASGAVPARLVILRSVEVGGIVVDNVQATVVEGDYPTTVLLGMTFLRHVEIRENGGILSLSRSW